MTTVYLIKHAEELAENGQLLIRESSQAINEKKILSVDGEKQALKLSQHPQLQHLSAIWSSSFARAKGTAKYLAAANNLPLNIDERLNERTLGNLDEIAQWMKNKTYGIVQEYLLNPDWHTSDGESCHQARKRIEDFVYQHLSEDSGKAIALVSHGAILSFLLANFCQLDDQGQLVHDSQIIEIKEPSITKLVFDDLKFVSLEMIDWENNS